MEQISGQGSATLVRKGIEFDKRDAILLKEIDQTGSIAKASTNLGRSRARELSRIDELEDVFGKLVKRQRGGKDGGGSKLTDTATQLLNQYERLQAALTATAQVPETVLEGTVSSISGELADVRTDLGTVRGLHDGVNIGDAVQVRVGADSLTVFDPVADPNPNTTSARNRLSGTVTAIQEGETVHTGEIDVESITFQAMITAESTNRLNLAKGCDVTLSWKATATRLTPTPE